MAFISLLLPRDDFQGWHDDLIKMLRNDTHHVVVSWRQGRSTLPGMALVEDLERLLGRRHRRPLVSCKSEPHDIIEQVAQDRPDIVFDLSGGDHPEAGSVIPLFDGLAGENARDAALFDERAPRLQLVSLTGGDMHILADALPALEHPWSLSAGRHAIAQRLVHLIRAVARDGSIRRGVARKSPEHRSGSPLTFISRTLTARIARRLRKLVAHDGHWRIGWRRIESGGSLYDTLRMPPASHWTWLDDDRQRYFADPFPFEHQGTTYVFCEEFPYATRSGIISVFTLDDQGRATRPRPVLDCGTHLSYPYVFGKSGQFWMMPENAANGALELYRADPFPDRWVLDRTLIAGRHLSDATPFRMNDRWWMTAADHRFGDSAWDTLALFESDNLLGPWRACGEEAFMIDARCARPGGAVVHRNEALWRPAQDCLSGYGSGLTLCRIDAVSRSGLEQTVMAHLGPPAGAAFNGVHTLNLTDRFEIIDAAGWMSMTSGASSALRR